VARKHGSLNKKTLEYCQIYDQHIMNGDDNPVDVLFKLLKNRKASIKLQAARELLSYRYPKQAVAKLEIEQAGQIVMNWEQSIEQPPAEPIDITPEPKVIN